MLRSILKQVIPPPLFERLRMTPALRRLQGERFPRIQSGIGTGLEFDPGPSNGAYATGANEEPMQQALAQHLKPGQTFFDIGANVGFFTVLGARLVGPRGKVFAFEPVPRNAVYVKFNARLNHFSHVSVLEKAVSSRSGQAKLWVAEYSGGAALDITPAPPDLKTVITVETVTVDQLTFGSTLDRETHPRPAVIKVDVEGAELDVFQGMTRTLAELRPVLVYEIDDGTQEGFDNKYQACEQFLLRAGYQVTRLPDSYPGDHWIVGHALATPKL